jgi:hypothetical protein
MTVQIAARVAHETELFGAIGTKEIVQALAKSGVEVDNKQVHLVDRIRKLGVYQVEVRLHKKVAVSVKLEVVNSDPNAPSLAETLAALEAARKAKAESKGDVAVAEAPAAEAKAEKPAKGDKAEKSAKGDKADKGAKADKPAKGDKAEAKSSKKKG